MLNERNEIKNNLQNYLQRFFIDSIELRIFGSSNTEIALFNADLVCFVFNIKIFFLFLGFKFFNK